MVQIVVRVPPDTPPWQELFVAGDGPLGDWAADGVPLQPFDDGTYRVELDLAPEFRGRFLVTPGRWRKAEADADGHEHLPRELSGDRSQPLNCHVRRWGRHSIRYHHEFASRFLPHPRTLTVWLPPGYDQEPPPRFPVFYMHDGQNLFDTHTAFAGHPWSADEKAEREIRAGRVQPLILVGIANTPERLNEYGPRRCGRTRAADRSREYGRFLVEEVKPFIDTTYRTRPEPENTGVGGSSMGGLISLHLCKWYPGVFSKCAALSPSLWWDREYFLRNVRVSPQWLSRVRIWLDVGDHEGPPRVTAATVRRTRRLASLFLQHGLRQGQDFHYAEVPGGEHNEHSWGSRFDQVLRFLFPAGSPDHMSDRAAG